jgi:N,N'-diacetyllegionaminate synthase
MGDGVKKPSISESKNIVAARKSIVALVDIEKGELFTEANLTVKRPGNGVSPLLWDKIIGNKSEKDYKKDDLI